MRIIARLGALLVVFPGVQKSPGGPQTDSLHSGPYNPGRMFGTQYVLSLTNCTNIWSAVRANEPAKKKDTLLVEKFENLCKWLSED